MGQNCQASVRVWLGVYFQVVEPDAVDEEDDVEEEEADEGADDERFAAIGVSQRPGKQSEDDPWSALKRTQPRLSRR